MTRFHILKALLLLVGITLIARCNASHLIRSWRIVNDELIAEWRFDTPFADAWTNSPALRRIVEERLTNAIVALSSATNHGLARLCSYPAMRKLDPKLAQQIGVSLILTTPITNIWSGQLLKLFAADAGSGYWRDALSCAFRESVGKDLDTARYMLRVLPQRELEKWLEANNNSRIDPVFKALAVQSVMLDLQKSGLRPTKTMIVFIDELVPIPGLPRAVFLNWADAKHPQYYDAMVMFLEDEAIADGIVTGTVYKRARYIRDNVKIETLRVSDGRRALLRRLLLP